MPAVVEIQGKPVSLKDLRNPLETGTVRLKQNLSDGATVYFKHCFLCHGDLLDGKGLFGDRFFPPPANFRDPVHGVVRKPQSYAFWRIMKGGRGLADSYGPWDSAMPAWENTLSEDEVWKVILFIYKTAGEPWRPILEDTPEPAVERGRKIYMEKCVYCHDPEGRGKGVSRPYSSPKPRKLYKGQYKFRTTPFGKIPTDQDLFDMLTRGMPGTTMPSWKHLSESDRWSLVLFLKTLSKKFAKFKAKGKVLQIIDVPDPPPFTLESAARGRQLFLENCSGCHGFKGRNDGEATHRIVNLASDALWPRNLSKPWLFRRGASRKDIFLDIRTGLSGTAMPRISSRTLKDDQVWDIVNFVETLSPGAKPKIERTLTAQRISGSISMDPEDPAWKNVKTFFIPLGGQIIQSEKLYFPMVDSVNVKAVHNEKEIAFHIHWDDPTFDPILPTLTPVTESPPPPLPAHLRALLAETEEEEEEEEEAEAPEPAEFPDALALQFPVRRDGAVKPYFLNGDADHPVNLWKWTSYPLKTLEWNATGLDHFVRQPEKSQEVASRVVYRYGRYQLVVKRKLSTSDKADDVQFEPGTEIPLAFNVWEGKEGETGTKKAVSSWFQLRIE